MKRARGLVLSLLVACCASLAQAVPALADTTIVVRSGDNLFRIAVAHGTTVDAIVRANHLASADHIRVGQALVIPGAAQTAPSGRGAPAAQPAAAVPVGQHIVQPGENLFRIALRHGTTVDALVRLNGLASADYVVVGQILQVPAAAGGAPAEQAAPARAAAPAARAPYGPRTILIDLSDQTLTAMEGGMAVRRMLVSTGKPSTPTPTGNYRVYNRFVSQDMSGPGYYAPGVPFVQYFYAGYAIHGTYWHTAFGVPVSHGCVNLQTPDAEWLWGWAALGTPVTVQW